MKRTDTTTYSDRIPGDRGNYDLPVRFDRTGKYIGITQTEEGGTLDRVLLSPAQVRELLVFIGK